MFNGRVDISSGGRLHVHVIYRGAIEIEGKSILIIWSEKERGPSEMARNAVGL